MLPRWIAMGLVVLAGTAAMAQAPAPSSPPAAAPAAKSITVIEPWARATPPGAKVGAAYLQLRATTADKLVSASSPVAGTTELHTHIMDGNVARMRRVESIAVPVGSTIAMKPGGNHVMLMDLKAPLKAGDTVKLRLVFEKAGEVEVDVVVRPLGNPRAGSGSGSGSGAATK